MAEENKNEVIHFALISYEIRKHFPEAEYLDFEAGWDTSNRCNFLYGFEIVNNKETIIRGLDLWQQNPELASIIEETIRESLFEEMEITQQLPEIETWFRFDFKTRDVEELE